MGRTTSAPSLRPARADHPAGRGVPAPLPTVLCAICFERVLAERRFVVPCGSLHSFCCDCVRQHVLTVAHPRCPAVGCLYMLTEPDVLLACGAGPRLEEFRAVQLASAVAALGGAVCCPSSTCSNVVICDPDQRSLVACPCGLRPFCSKCRQPYHYHADCEAIEPLRQQWLQWILQGLSAYTGSSAVDSNAAKRHAAALEKAAQQHAVLVADEAYKAKRCRHCPKCFRVIEMLERRCGNFRCGRDADGGNDQDGCGHSFRWDDAPMYRARAQGQLALPALGPESARLRFAMARHFFVTCSVCNVDIVGPRLRCIHCCTFDACATCSGHLGKLHPQDHVFQVILQPLESINLDLPPGTAVGLFGLDGPWAGLNGASAKVVRFSLDLLSYDLDLPFATVPPLHMQHVQPLAVDTYAAQEVLELAAAQQEARRFCFGLREGQRVQLLTKECEACRELSHDLGTVLRFFAGNGGWCKVRPDTWAQEGGPRHWCCAQCSERVLASVPYCAWWKQRPPRASLDAMWVPARFVMPTISTAAEVKDLAQRHWAAEGRVAALSAGPGCVTSLDQDSLWDALSCADAELVLALFHHSAEAASSAGSSGTTHVGGRQAFMAPAGSEWERVIGAGITALHVAASWWLEARHAGDAKALATWSEVVWKMATRPDVSAGPRGAILTARLHRPGSAGGRAWVAGQAGQTVSGYVKSHCQDSPLVEMLDQLMEPGGSDVEMDPVRSHFPGKGFDDDGKGTGRWH